MKSYIFCFCHTTQSFICTLVFLSDDSLYPFCRSLLLNAKLDSINVFFLLIFTCSHFFTWQASTLCWECKENAFRISVKKRRWWIYSCSYMQMIVFFFYITSIFVLSSISLHYCKSPSSPQPTCPAFHTMILLVSFQIKFSRYFHPWTDRIPHTHICMHIPLSLFLVTKMLLRSYFILIELCMMQKNSLKKSKQVSATLYYFLSPPSNSRDPGQGVEAIKLE